MCTDQVDVGRLGFVFGNFLYHMAVLRLSLAGLRWLEAAELQLSQASVAARLDNLGLLILVLDALILFQRSVFEEVERARLAIAAQRRPVGVEFQVLVLRPPSISASMAWVLYMDFAHLLKVLESGFARLEPAPRFVDTQQRLIHSDDVRIRVLDGMDLRICNEPDIVRIDADRLRPLAEHDGLLRIALLRALAPLALAALSLVARRPLLILGHLRGLVRINMHLISCILDFRIGRQFSMLTHLFRLL